MNTTDDSEAQWRASLMFGIKEIDDQHQQLFKLIDSFEAALAERERALALHQVLGDIKHWASIHFAVEEALMGLMKYPHLANHRASHQVFLKKLVIKQVAALQNDLTGISPDWLRHWLKEHIDIEDRAYVNYFSPHPSNT